MAREIDQTIKAALLGEITSLAVLVSADFGPTDGMLYLTNAQQSIWWGATEYLGAGNLLSIGEMAESTEVQGYSLAISLSAITQVEGGPSGNELIIKALNLNYRNKALKVFLAVLDPTSYEVSGKPIPVFAGRMDVMNINLAGTGSISVNATSRLSDWETPHGGRFNHSYQARIDPLDEGFEYVPQMKDIEIVWGISRNITDGTKLSPTPTPTGGKRILINGHLFTFPAGKLTPIPIDGQDLEGVEKVTFGSDRRLKTNIKLVGYTDKGFPWYTFDYVWGQPFFGVMADEIPESMRYKGPHGYWMVDYNKVLD